MKVHVQLCFSASLWASRTFFPFFVHAISDDLFLALTFIHMEKKSAAFEPSRSSTPCVKTLRLYKITETAIKSKLFCIQTFFHYSTRWIYKTLFFSEPKGLNTSPKAQNMNLQSFGVADLKLVKSRLFCAIYFWLSDSCCWFEPIVLFCFWNLC